MNNDETRVTAAPERTNVVPDTYAIYVNGRSVDVWQYRVDLDEPDGDWRFVETHGAEDDLRVSIDLARLTPPSENGYWVYSRTYDCETDCT